MPNMSDQDFDNLFREAANRIAPDFETGDWEEMTRRLERAERDARARSYSLYSMAAMLFVYSLLPQYMAATKETETTVAVVIDKQEFVANTDDRSGNQRDAMDADGRKGSGAIVESEPGGSNTVALHDQSTDENDAVDGTAHTGSVIGNDSAAENSKAIQQRSAETLKVGDQALSSGNGPSADGIGRASNAFFEDGPDVRRGPQLAGASTLIPPALPTALRAAIVSPDYDPDTRGQEVVQAVDPRAIRETVVKHAQVSPRHLLFARLALAPDFSSIDYGKVGKAGVNAGLLIDYAVSPRFTLSTGAIWSKKLYDQENPDKLYSWGSNSANAKMLNGDCRIVDIPVNVTYYMFPGQRTNLFITVGSSSYLMLNEEYIYTVWRNNRDYEYVENYSRENNEWFSVLNVSVGVQHQVGRRWFVQGEPFLKAPIQGIGEGKVSLVSTGVFFSLKYLINK